MENIFYFKHSILNTPCPPSLGARLRDLKLFFTIGFSNSFLIRPFPTSSQVRWWQGHSPCPGGFEQLEGWILGSPLPTKGDIPGKLLGHGAQPLALHWCVCHGTMALATPRGMGRMRTDLSTPSGHLVGTGESPPACISDVMKCQLLPSPSSMSLKPTRFNQESLQFISS